MNVQEIRNNIIYNENLIDQYNLERSSLNKDIEELELLRTRSNNLQMNFQISKDTSVQKLSLKEADNVSNSIFGKFLAGMNLLLTGNEFETAYYGMSDAKAVINTKLNEKFLELENCNNNITYRNQRLNYWREQLRLTLAEEESK